MDIISRAETTEKLSRRKIWDRPEWTIPNVFSQPLLYAPGLPRDYR